MSFFAQRVKTSFLLNFHFLQTLEGDFDRFEVGHHAAQPALVNERHAGTQSFGGQDFACLALGTDHQHITAVSRQLAHELGRGLEHRERFFQVDDMNFVAMTENKRGHLRVPETGLVSEMNARI
jgi:diaminopimelate epimerase